MTERKNGHCIYVDCDIFCCNFNNAEIHLWITGSAAASALELTWLHTLVEDKRGTAALIYWTVQVVFPPKKANLSIKLIQLKIRKQSTSQAMSEVNSLTNNKDELSWLSNVRMALSPSTLMLLLPMGVSSRSNGSTYLLTISCDRFNHNYPQSKVHSSITNNLLNNPYGLCSLPQSSIDNDAFFGGLAKKLVSYPSRLRFH